VNQRTPFRGLSQRAIFLYVFGVGISIHELSKNSSFRILQSAFFHLLLATCYSLWSVSQRSPFPPNSAENKAPFFKFQSLSLSETCVIVPLFLQNPEFEDLLATLSPFHPIFAIHLLRCGHLSIPPKEIN
jgi:hypothetical protein